MNTNEIEKQLKRPLEERIAKAKAKGFSAIGAWRAGLLSAAEVGRDKCMLDGHSCMVYTQHMTNHPAATATIPALECKECGAVWAPRLPTLPMQCPRCRTRHWFRGNPAAPEPKEIIS